MADRADQVMIRFSRRELALLSEAVAVMPIPQDTTTRGSSSIFGRCSIAKPARERNDERSRNQDGRARLQRRLSRRSGEPLPRLRPKPVARRPIDRGMCLLFNGGPPRQFGEGLVMAFGVSDKALLRFLELAADLDIAGLRNSLNASIARAHTAARTVSKSDYLIKADGLIYVVRGDAVTTVTEDKEPIGRAAVLAKQHQ